MALESGPDEKENDFVMQTHSLYKLLAVGGGLLILVGSFIWYALWRKRVDAILRMLGAQTRQRLKTLWRRNKHVTQLQSRFVEFHAAKTVNENTLVVISFLCMVLLFTCFYKLDVGARLVQFAFNHNNVGSRNFESTPEYEPALSNKVCKREERERDLHYPTQTSVCLPGGPFDQELLRLSVNVQTAVLVWVFTAPLVWYAIFIVLTKVVTALPENMSAILSTDTPLRFLRSPANYNGSETNTTEWTNDYDSVAEFIQVCVAALKDSSLAGEVLDVFPARHADDLGNYHVRIYINSEGRAQSWPSLWWDHDRKRALVAKTTHLSTPNLWRWFSMLHGAIKDEDYCLSDTEVCARYFPPLSPKEAREGNLLLSRHAAQLLTVPGVSAVTIEAVRHTRDGALKENCVAVYVREKGVLPLNSLPLPRSLDGWALDVREGVFEFAAEGRKFKPPFREMCIPSYDDLLTNGMRLGYSVGQGPATPVALNPQPPEDGRRTCSMGPVVRDKNGSLGFLTCGHAFEHGHNERRVMCPSAADAAHWKDRVSRRRGLVCGTLARSILGNLDGAGLDVGLVVFNSSCTLMKEPNAFPICTGLFFRESLGLDDPDDVLRLVGGVSTDDSNIAEVQETPHIESGTFSCQLPVHWFCRTMGHAQGNLRAEHGLYVSRKDPIWLGRTYESQTARIDLFRMLSCATSVLKGVNPGDSGALVYAAEDDVVSNGLDGPSGVASVPGARDVRAVAMVVGWVGPNGPSVLMPLARALRHTECTLALPHSPGSV
jgi:hypothetical protein